MTCHWCGRPVYDATVHPCCATEAVTDPDSPCEPCRISADRARSRGEDRGRDIRDTKGTAA